MYSLIKSDHVGSANPVCSNPGDNLIAENCKAIILKEFDQKCGFEVCYDRIDESALQKINESDFVVISSRAPALEEGIAAALPRIKVPVLLTTLTQLISPKDGIKGFLDFSIPEESKKILIEKFGKYSIFPTREYLTELIMKKNGFANAVSVGDWALYNFGDIVKEMKIPTTVNRVVFTVGHYLHYYRKQTVKLMEYIRTRFQNAEIIYSTHIVNPDAQITEMAKKLHFKIVPTEFLSSTLDFYKDCDLHIGYRLHGHIKALSCGVPSVLFAEDSRGLGFSYTLDNVGVFPAFSFENKTKKKFGLFKNKKRIAVSPDSLLKQLEKHLDNCFITNFLPYRGIPDKIQFLYQARLLPHLKEIFSEVC